MDMRDESYSSTYLSINPTAQSCIDIANDLVNNFNSQDEFLTNIAPILRKSIDEVIDMPRTQRYSLAQIEKTEKTYIGTKVEILLRHSLRLPKGNILDLQVEGKEVDIKNTIGSSWMIPKEAVNQHCLLVKINDKKGLFSIGVVYCSLANISLGMNQDKKRSISSGNQAIFWIGKNIQMQKNFFENLNHDICLQLTDPRVSGAERVRRLCTLVPNVVFNRYIVECVAQQKDSMKRLRSNGGARDKLLSHGIHVLSGKYDQEKLKAFGFNNVNANEWVAVHPDSLTLTK